MSSERPLDPYAAPQAAAELPQPREHTRWGIVSLAAALGAALAMVGFFVFALLVVIVKEVDRFDASWTQAVSIAWVLLLFLGSFVAVVSGGIGCLRFRHRRWTAVVGVTLGAAEFGALIALAIAA